MANSTPRTYQQIESTADFYSPSIYENLPRFSSLKAMADPLAGDFVPLTSVGIRSAKDAKMFVIGILPPSSNVTGRLLDRSASVAILTQQAVNAIDSTAAPANYPSQDFYTALVATANQMGVKPEALAAVLNGETGFNASQVNAIGAKGMSQMLRSTAQKIGMSKEDWDNYENLSGAEQLPWIAKAMSPCRGMNEVQLYAKNLGGYAGSNPVEVGTIGGLYYVSRAYVGNHGGASDPKWDNPKLNLPHQYSAYEQNEALDRDHDGAISDADMATQAAAGMAGVDQSAIDAAKKRIQQGGSLQFSADVLTGQALADSWAGSGTANASRAQKQQQKIANTDLNMSDMGQALLQKQIAMIKATLAALDTMRNTPPLRMLVNPQSFKTSSEKICSDGNRSRSQPIIEHWGEQQDKLEASGKIAGFYAADMVGNADVSNRGSSGTSTHPYPDTVGTYPGLTRSARQFSKSWQNFLSLYMIYRSNGGLFLEDFYEASQSKDPDNFTDTTLSVVGSVYIYYDNILYIGSFDTFSITEDDTAPYTVEYNFAFTVRATFLLDSVDDPKFTYGAPQMFSPSAAIPTTTTGGLSAEDQWLAKQQADNDYNAKLAQQAKDQLLAQQEAEAKVRQAQQYDPMAGLGGAVLNPPDPWERGGIHASIDWGLPPKTKR